VESFSAPVASNGSAADAAAQYRDLRRFLVQIIERHIEKKLVTAGMLAKL